MNKRARFLAALRGEPVDRVPISVWGHHYIAENSAAGLAQETLRQARRFDWDYLKPQSRAQAFAEMWGLTYTPSDVADRKYTTTHVPLHNADGLARLQPAAPPAARSESRSKRCVRSVTVLARMCRSCGRCFRR